MRGCSAEVYCGNHFSAFLWNSSQPEFSIVYLEPEVKKIFFLNLQMGTCFEWGNLGNLGIKTFYTYEIQTFFAKRNGKI